MTVTVGLVVLAAVMVGFTGVDQFKGNTKQTGDKVKTPSALTGWSGQR